MNHCPQIYFVQDTFGFVKIGFSNDVTRRVGDLQVASSSELHLIRVIDGGSKSEKWLHNRFADRKVRGEWFKFCDEMMSIYPPEEFEVRKVVKRRDVNLTAKEKMRDAARLAEDMSLPPNKRIMFLLGGMTDDQAVEILTVVGEHFGLPLSNFVGSDAA